MMNFTVVAYYSTVFNNSLKIIQLILLNILLLGNVGEIVTLIDNWPFQLILNGFFSVDSFFLLR